ncbi:MAG TPA: FAD-dependent oxidoreductase, partial [Acetobacteraceae bacterium]
MTLHPSSSSSSEAPTVAIIGAGVIGLGIGWRLAAAGCRVDIFDRGAAGAGASHAAAGMLAASAEAEPGEEALLALNRHSLALWPGFAAELEALTGQTVDLRTEGTLVLAPTADDVARLRFGLDFQKSLGLATRWLDAAELRRREPHVSPAVAGAVFSPEDHQVDNRKLAHALRLAVERAGGRIHERCPVTRIEIDGGRVAGIRADGTLVAADRVVLAAGAWSRGIDGLPPEALPPVRPVKGQMLAVRMDP